VFRLIAVFVYTSKCEPMLAPDLVANSTAKTYLYPYLRYIEREREREKERRVNEE
jgi:hypothetical protein